MNCTPQKKIILRINWINLHRPLKADDDKTTADEALLVKTVIKENRKPGRVLEFSVVLKHATQSSTFKNQFKSNTVWSPKTVTVGAEICWASAKPVPLSREASLLRQMTRSGNETLDGTVLCSKLICHSNFNTRGSWLVPSEASVNYLAGHRLNLG